METNDLVVDALGGACPTRVLGFSGIGDTDLSHYTEAFVEVGRMLRRVPEL